MAPPTGTALLILAVYVLPGFVTLLLRERMFDVRWQETQFERLLNALYYSALIYAIVLAGGAALGLSKTDVVQFYKGEKLLAEDLEAAALIVIGLPMILAITGLQWRKSRRARPWLLQRFGISIAHGGVKSGWNEAFGREDAMMVRVTLKAGRVVGGYFGKDSIAGYSERAQDLFLDERWSLDPEDDWFTERAAGTKGVWMPREQIVSAEFYEVPDDEPSGQTMANGELS
ncbi:MAG TPA: DUF6338 family protein [Solirubrobacteraceae bacterium]|nr:DUF6338 family protein [Solirubrobacteraceae bacterium]